MTLTANQRIGAIAFGIILLDQVTKWAVLRFLGFAEERVVVDGFFKFVHWGNTGAAWSLFDGNNELLAIFSLVALLVLFLTRHHFNTHTVLGQTAMGVIFGGITGNMIDRLHVGHVTDFLYFYYERANGKELGFPAFNVADAAICTGVGLLFLLSWKMESQPKPAAERAPQQAEDLL